MNKDNFYSFTIDDKNNEGLRIDKFISLNIHNQIKISISRARIQKAIKTGLVTCNNLVINNLSYKTKIGDIITLDYQENLLNDFSGSLKPTPIEFEIIFEDEHLAVINKPSGLTTHPGAGNYENTLVNALLYKFKDRLSDGSGDLRPGIVHRLDKDTSGVMLVAKTNPAHYALSQQIQNKEVIRKYLAYVYGVLNPQSGQIDKNIKRSRINRLKMTTTNSKIGSRNATTLYNTLSIFGNNFASLVECQLLTGRTHQIRVHLESEKHSIIGDQTYNSCQKQIPDAKNNENYQLVKKFDRQALHSYQIEFTHPFTKEFHKYICKPSSDLEMLQKSLELI